MQNRSRGVRVPPLQGKMHFCTPYLIFFSGLTLADKNVHKIRIQPFQLATPDLLGQIGTISSDFTTDYKNAFIYLFKYSVNNKDSCRWK